MTDFYPLFVLEASLELQTEKIPSVQSLGRD